MSSALTPAKERRFQACYEQIKKGLQDAFDTGAALAEMKNDKLYEGRFETFEEFCRDTFNISLNYANRLIAAEALRKELVPIGTNQFVPIGTKITNEAQARALASVPESKRESVLEAVLADGPITARAITVHAAEKKVDAKRAESAPVLDMTGWPIPEGLHALWARRGEVEEMSREIAGFENLLLKYQKEEDPLWAGVGYNEIIGKLQNVHQCIGRCRLHAVCVSCAGRNFAKCAHCKGKGFLSKFLWDSTVPAEVKAMRGKGKRP